ncbi:MAG: hypothetical protein CMB64_01115 [Euryarchaeota archaeon]|nr:hypothetical protein [Euryarchaeota archaeon]
MSTMGLVTDVDDENAPIVLIVDNNPMSRRRIEQSLRTKDFLFIYCEDGDNAVDIYTEKMPDLVIMALDIPSMDGHVAALEIREVDPEARIIFLAPKRLAKLAEDAAYSAGAVACIEKPVSASLFDEVWNKVLGPIPEAPGLQDLDELYPKDLDSKTQELPDLGVLPPLDTLPPLGNLPPLEGLPPLETLPSLEVPIASTSSPTELEKTTKGLKRKAFLLTIILFSGLVGGYLWSLFGDIPYI